jgi:hypothetical protein
MNIPSTIKTNAKGAWADIKQLRPLHQRFRLPLKRHEARISPVPRLLFLCSPAAIAWFVIAVVIYPVQSVFFTWTQPHVSQKHLKNQPPFAYAYTSSAIARIRGIICIVAPRFHSAPHHELLCVRHAMGLGSFYGCLSLITSATLRVASSHWRRTDKADFPTVAYTSPKKSFLAGFFVESNHLQPAVAMSS